MIHLLTFPSTHLAMKAETFLERDGVRFKLRSKPRTISAQCGLAIQLAPGELDRALDSLARRSVVEFSVYARGEETDDWIRVDPRRLALGNRRRREDEGGRA